VRGRGRKAPPLPESEQARWVGEMDRELWTRVGMAIGQWLIDSQTSLNRPLHLLRQEELLGMGWAAVCAYHKLRISREQEIENGPADPKQLGLFG